MDTVMGMVTDMEAVIIRMIKQKAKNDSINYGSNRNTYKRFAYYKTKSF